MATRFDLRSAARAVEHVDLDAGLRAYMLRVYNYMALGVALTGALAFFISTSPAALQLFFNFQTGGLTPLGWVAMLSPLGVVLVLSFGINRMSPFAAQALFWVYAALNGIGFSILFIMFTGEEVARAFFITAGMFAGMSLIGYTTKRDLTGLGGFLMMGVIGLLIAIVVNMFLQSSGLMFLISIVSVLIFAGLTMYDTQKIKQWYDEADSRGSSTRKAVFGALMLYIDFIVMFRNILYLMALARD